MRLRLSLCVFALVGCSVALECPLVTCSALEPGICARKVDDTSFELNTEVCPEGRFCSGQRLYEDWWFASTTDAGDEYPCWDMATFHHLSYSQSVNATVWPCGVRDTNKNLKDGSHPKACASNHDCELLDGSYSHCYCAMQMYSNFSTITGFCSPDINSDLFATTWGLCDSDGNLGDLAQGRRDLVYQRAYHILQSDTPCANELLWEFIAISQLDADILASSLLLSTSILLLS